MSPNNVVPFFALGGISAITLALIGYREWRHSVKRNRKEVHSIEKGPVPILLLTDIGRDIDDTIALFLLVGLVKSGRAKLVGVIGTGGAGRKRACVVRGWLRALGLPNEDTLVAADDSHGMEGCHVPDMAPDESNANLFCGDAAGMIRELAIRFAGELEIFAIAPLSSLAHAIREERGLRSIRESIRCLHIQGQASIDGRTGLMRPDFSAFNLRMDKEAANEVFDKLQGHIPFRLLGKHAAYRVGLTKKDFEGWDALIGGSEITGVARNTMNVFRQGNPDLFRKLYPSVPLDKFDTDEWFNFMTVVSHPYDPLLILSGFHSEIFAYETVCSQALLPLRPWNIILRRATYRNNRVVHKLIGNRNDGSTDAGVPNPQRVHDVLCRLVTESLQHFQQYNHKRK